MKLLVEVGAGELFDKISILQIKAGRITDPGKLANIRRELGALEAVVASSVPGSERLAALREELKGINERLWTIEDDIRDRERARDFGDAFVALARAVYITNDERARVKRAIDEHLGSRLVEEKSYRDYRA
jgi:hypothetical protein